MFSLSLNNCVLVLYGMKPGKCGCKPAISRLCFNTTLVELSDVFCMEAPSKLRRAALLLWLLYFLRKVNNTTSAICRADYAILTGYAVS